MGAAVFGDESRLEATIRQEATNIQPALFALQFDQGLLLENS